MKALCSSYGASGIHQKMAGRKIHSKDVFSDAYEKGEAVITQGKVIANWHKRREREVSEKEIWVDDEDEFLFE